MNLNPVPRISAFYAGLERSYRFYFLSVTAFFIFLAMAFVRLPLRDSIIALLLCEALAAIGFLFWIVPMIKARWHALWCKILLSIFSAFVGVLSIAKARYWIAGATGLPPQDFELSVTLFALLAYIPAWIIVSMFILCLLFLILFVLSLVLVSSTWPIVNDALNIGARLTRGHASEYLAEGRRKELCKIFFAHFVGSGCLLTFLVATFAISPTVCPDFDQFINIAVAYLDFYPAPAHPMTKGRFERVRFMGDGLIMTAVQKQDGHIEFEALLPFAQVTRGAKTINR